MNNVEQFIQDFKNSVVYKNIIEDNKVEIIMLFLTGTTLLQTQDDHSDYDICVLVKEKPAESQKELFKVYSRPGSYFMYYKAQNKIVQWIYNDLNDISSITTTPLDNIGWAQFKYIKEDYIIYKNSKYLDFIEDLIGRKQEISNYALQLFVKAALNFINENNVSSNLVEMNRNIYKPVKLLAHICWASDVLQNKIPDNYKINEIKRVLLEDLSEDCINYINTSIDFLKNYSILN